MSRVEIAPEVLGDFERIFDHLAQHDPENAPERIGAIIQTLDVVEANPLVGRPAANGMPALVIGRGSNGYVAPYRYVDAFDAVFVVAVRSQREAGYRRG